MCLNRRSDILDMSEKERMETIVGSLEPIWRMEEVKVRQRSRDRDRYQEGDQNTTYFQAVPNQRNRKERISGLERSRCWIEENSKLVDDAMDFYKSLFGQEELSLSEVRLGGDFLGRGRKGDLY
jgi:hypothetical protein